MEGALYLAVSKESATVIESVGPIDSPRLLLKFSQIEETNDVHVTYSFKFSSFIES